MVLNICNQNENILTDNSGNIDLLDFAYFVEKYMGYEASDYFTKAVSSLYSEITILSDELDALNKKLLDTVELSEL